MLLCAAVSIRVCNGGGGGGELEENGDVCCSYPYALLQGRGDGG